MWDPMSERRRISAWAHAVEEYLKEKGFPTQRPYPDEVVIAPSDPSLPNVENFMHYPHTRIAFDSDGSVTVWHAGPPGTTKPFKLSIYDPNSFQKIEEFVGRYDYEA
jgi:hypothetical protein